jgi:hypothetical protein
LSSFCYKHQKKDGIIAAIFKLMINFGASEVKAEFFLAF